MAVFRRVRNPALWLGLVLGLSIVGAHLARANCGDGVTTVGEACDAGTAICQPPAANAGSPCKRATDCQGGPAGTDLCACTGASCNNGVGNRDDVANACRSSCMLASCGDGVSDNGEQCDRGANGGDDKPCLGDAPNSVCAIGATVADNPFIPGATVRCTNDADCFLFGGAAKCTGNPQCRLNVCGDSRVCSDPNCVSGSRSLLGASPGFPGPEACDDGNTNDMDACTSATFSAAIGGVLVPDRCQVNICGDGVTNGGVEECDAGAAVCVSGPRVGKGCCKNADCGVGNFPGQCSGQGGATNVSGFDNRNDVPNGTTGNISCPCTCNLPTCGDGISDSGEGCDDGNLTTGPHDYCNAVRRCEGGENPGALCTSNAACIKGTCPTTLLCEQNACGDGTTNNSEECDDGNTVAADAAHPADRCGISPAVAAANPKPPGCNPALLQNLPNACIPAACRLGTCGDGVTQTGETCDAGTATCTGGFNAGAACAKATDCKNGTCGSGNRDDLPNTCRSNCHAPGCGDGISDSGEQCDDGANNGDSKPCVQNLLVAGQTRQCVLNTCGDGKVCSDARCTSGPICSAQGVCTAGPGVGLGGPEQCDNGNLTNPALTCFKCISSTCGNNVLDANEQCDSTSLGCSNHAELAAGLLASCCFNGTVVDTSRAALGLGFISVDQAFSALLGCRLQNLAGVAACDKTLQKTVLKIHDRVLAAQLNVENGAIAKARRNLRTATQRLVTLSTRLARMTKPGGRCAAQAAALTAGKEDAGALVNGIAGNL